MITCSSCTRFDHARLAAIHSSTRRTGDVVVGKYRVERARVLDRGELDDNTPFIVMKYTLLVGRSPSFASLSPSSMNVLHE